MNETVPVEQVTDSNRIDRPSGAVMASFLHAVDDAVVDQRASPGQRSAIEIVDTDISPNLLPLFLNPHGNAELRAVVLNTGFIKSIEVSYDFHRGNETLRFVWRTEFTLKKESSLTPRWPNNESMMTG